MINQKQEKFINALIVSSSISEACKVAEISRTTGYEYLKVAEVADKYKELQIQRNELTLDYMQAQSQRALEYLSGVLVNEQASNNERIKAAQVLLSQFSKSLEIQKRNREPDLGFCF